MTLDYINTYMCTGESCNAGLFGDFGLIGTYVRMILMRKDCFVTLD